MAYQVNKTDGTIVATVADGQIDQLSTNLTLIGKNYSGFGEALNENFIKLLENFASTAVPTRPIKGQIWFDTNELKLKVYSGAEFIPVSSATIASTQPLSLGTGDLWFNDVDKQLYFYDGTNTILLGPSYSVSQGLSGLKVDSILDTLNQTRVITYLYTNGILLGIFAKDTFTPKNTIIGFTGSITPGFNAGNLENLKFNVTVSNADTLGRDVEYPSGVPASVYVRNDSANDINGLLRITQDAGIIIGSANQLNLSINSGNVNIANSAGERNITMSVRRSGTQENALIINSTTRIIDLYSNFSNSRVNVGGDIVVAGNLTVNGSTTTVNTETLTVEDKNIELAKVTSPTDDNADGGGITLKGSTDHTIVWKNNGVSTPELGTAWNVNDHINLVGEKYFAINGEPLLDSDTVYVSNFPNVNQLGTQLSVSVGTYTGEVANPEMLLENNKISTFNDLDLEIEPSGTGNVVLLGNPKITGLADPTAAQDAATKEYVDNVSQTQDIVFSMDLTDARPNSYIITQILNRLAEPPATNPVSKYRNGTYARILCTLLANQSQPLNINPLISLTTTTVNTPTGTTNAVTGVAIATATIPGATINTTRIIKVFQIELGAWRWVSDTLLPPA
jgi:hypothetical protein